MAWRVMIGDKTFGPMTAELVGEMLRDGRLGAGVFVKEDEGAWAAIERSPFQGLVEKRKMPLLDVIVRVASAIVAIWIVSLFLWHCSGFGVSLH